MKIRDFTWVSFELQQFQPIYGWVRVMGGTHSSLESALSDLNDSRNKIAETKFRLVKITRKEEILHL